LQPGIQQSHRDALFQALTSQGIGCARYFAPIHLQPAYTARKNLSLPVTESESARTIALPFFNRITTEQLDQVCEALSRELRRL
jgi:perosamine synthetase